MASEDARGIETLGRVNPGHGSSPTYVFFHLEDGTTYVLSRDYLPQFTSKDLERVEKYKRAYGLLAVHGRRDNTAPVEPRPLASCGIPSMLEPYLMARTIRCPAMRILCPNATNAQPNSTLSSRPTY